MSEIEEIKNRLKWLEDEVTQLTGKIPMYLTCVCPCHDPTNKNPVACGCPGSHTS